MPKSIHSYPRLKHHGWSYFSQGSYNFVYLSQCEKFILKIPKKDLEYIEDPKRSREIFCEIHPNWAHQTYLFNNHGQQGWIMPYFKGTPANDKEIASLLICIYQRTGRIVLDAPSKNNFISTLSGEVICVDVGFALRIQSSLTHNASQTSLTQWSMFQNDFEFNFLINRKNLSLFPHTIHTIKALLFIQYLLPDFKDCDFLMAHPQTAQSLAILYDKRNQLYNHEKRGLIQKILFLPFETLKYRCIEILMQYLQAHCVHDRDFDDFQANPCAFKGELKLSWWNYIFQYETILQHVKIFQDIIQQITLALDKNQLIEILKNGKTHSSEYCFSSEPTFDHTIEQCQNLLSS